MVLTAALKAAYRSGVATPIAFAIGAAVLGRMQRKVLAPTALGAAIGTVVVGRGLWAEEGEDEDEEGDEQTAPTEATPALAS